MINYFLLRNSTYLTLSIRNCLFGHWSFAFDRYPLMHFVCFMVLMNIYLSRYKYRVTILLQAFVYLVTYFSPGSHPELNILQSLHGESTGRPSGF